MNGQKIDSLTIDKAVLQEVLFNSSLTGGIFIKLSSNNTIQKI
jgi:hypothetical protein